MLSAFQVVGAQCAHRSSVLHENKHTFWYSNDTIIYMYVIITCHIFKINLDLNLNVNACRAEPFIAIRLHCSPFVFVYIFFVFFCFIILVAVVVVSLLIYFGAHSTCYYHACATKRNIST